MLTNVPLIGILQICVNAKKKNHTISAAGCQPEQCFTDRFSAYISSPVCRKWHMCGFYASGRRCQYLLTVNVKMLMVSR